MPMRLPIAARWLLVILWMLLIFLLSARSDSGDQSNAVMQFIFSILGKTPEPASLEFWHHVLRKAAHFSEFAVLALLILFAQARLAAKAG